MSMIFVSHCDAVSTGTEISTSAEAWLPCREQFQPIFGAGTLFITAHGHVVTSIRPGARRAVAHNDKGNWRSNGRAQTSIRHGETPSSHIIRKLT